VTPKRAYDRIKQLLGDRCAFDVPMAPLTTWRVGGKADCLVRPETAEEVTEVVRLCLEYNVPLRVVGIGSNLLILDGGLRGVTILMRQGFNQFQVEWLDDETALARVGAAMTMAEAVENCIVNGVAGLEFLAGIPGGIGGGVRMNAGTRDGDISRVLHAVTVVDGDGNVRRIPRDKLVYRYRGLVIDGPYVVLEAELKLRRGNSTAIREKVDKIIAWRYERHPYDLPSGGSTFKNPEDQFAACLIEDAGLKGYSIGGAEVSRKHSNFIVNTGEARAADILALIEHVRQVVFEKFGVMLEPEVKIWGEKDVAE